MEKKKTKSTEFSLEVKRETPAAILVSDGGEKDQWLPKSQIQYDKTAFWIGAVLPIVIPDWLAKEKGYL